MGVNQGGGHIQNQLRQLKKECYLDCQLGKGILQQKYDENLPTTIFRDFSILPGFLKSVSGSFLEKQSGNISLQG